ncbi:helix-turn-helix domain-containing protein [Listeria seeligeri]|nr:helix-turn-helix domain-containing protein [Listeria seeligeri]
MAIVLRLDRIMADRKMSLNQLSNKVSAIRFSTLNEICKVLECQPGDI